MKKICSHCKQSLLLNCFGKNRHKKDGLNAKCKKCVRQYYHDNRERILKYYQKNKEGILEKCKQYYQNNKEKIAEQGRKYRQNNKERGAKIKRICKTCGVVFCVNPHRIKNGQGIYCSRNCMAIDYKEVTKKKWEDPKWREKVSKAIKIAQGCPKVRKRKSETQKITQNQPEIKKRNSERQKKLWTNPEYKRKHLKANKKRPTNPEKIFNEITPEIVRYTGNGTWWRQMPKGITPKHKNPDFKVTGQDKVIEIFGDYWHRNDDPQELINLYAQVGIDCLIFWEKEIYDNPKQVKERVNNFII